MEKTIKTISLCVTCFLLAFVFALPSFASEVTGLYPSSIDVMNNIKYQTSTLLPEDKLTPNFVQGWSVDRQYFTTLIRFEERCYYRLSSGLDSYADAILLRWAYDENSERRLILAQTQYFNTETQKLEKRNTFFVREVPESWGTGFTQTESYSRIEWLSQPKIAFVNGFDMGRATMEDNALYYSANYILFGKYASDLYSGNGMFYPTFENGQSPTTPPDFLGGFTGWFFNVLDSILTIKWFGWFSIGTLLGCFFAISVTLLFLKMFAGG